MPGNGMGAFHLMVKAGSRDETPQTAGLAHFLEHMFFKGSVSRPSTQAVSREMAKLGAYINAWTNVEQVCYHSVAPAPNLNEVLAIYLDMLAHPVFEEEEFQKEKKVVLQDKVLLGLQVGDSIKWMAFQLVGEVIQADENLDTNAIADFDELEAREYLTRGYSVMLVRHEEGLPITSVLTQAAIWHFTRYLEQVEKNVEGVGAAGNEAGQKEKGVI
jgi:hypothetical protein